MLFIKKKYLEQLLDLLRQQGELHGPLMGDDGVLRFSPLSAGVLPDLAAARTLLPPKKYLLAPRETILTYGVDSGYQLPSEVIPRVILFGLHPCDLAAIKYLDLLFLGEGADPLYASRRNALTLIGTSCIPDELCTCHLQRSPLQAAFDLYLQQIDNGFALSIGSPKGRELLDLLSPLMEDLELSVPADSRDFFGQPLRSVEEPELDPSLPDWQILADRCLGCGACSFSCPTCACYDVLEFGGLDGRSAERLRFWDNCLFKSHSQVAGGLSFQKDRSGRFRYRYRHKYSGFGQLSGIPGCVGCGRCRAVCPSGLDLRLLAERLAGGGP